MGRPAKAAPPPVDPDEPVDVFPPDAGFFPPYARALLAACDRTGYDQRVVESMFGGFRAPAAVVAATQWPDHPEDGRGTAPVPLEALELGALAGEADAAT